MSNIFLRSLKNTREASDYTDLGKLQRFLFVNSIREISSITGVIIKADFFINIFFLRALKKNFYKKILPCFFRNMDWKT
ncbi:MAG: hypothetical protein A2042_06560 [Candidatus Schekmanbacteria bacterium GWA2_38_11]|uniref:Uncharacterized protein n=1 Tax=Candidatus Schekmanbacteria bacterium GWA2_38_11 TaxID=1817876 RepID=A0A1F7RI84_9BACT|nr:MAG: hypothetical protein A2042_06560 [Candidatus Schekmanbacteria bacterium GWA2_38_11]